MGKYNLRSEKCGNFANLKSGAHNYSNISAILFTHYIIAGNIRSPLNIVFFCEFPERVTELGPIRIAKHGTNY